MLIRRSRPSVVVAPPPPPDEREAERRSPVMDRRQGERRLQVANRLTAADILARSRERPTGPVVANSTGAKEAIHRAQGLKINDQLKLIAKAEADIDDAQLRLTQAREEVERLLREANMDHHSDGVYIAEIVETFTRQSRTIDPKKLRVKAGDTAFWKCITVNIGKAEEFLSKKEMDDISDIVESKSTGFSLKVKKLEIKTRKKS